MGDAFINDSIDLGETGRINYRTGSFLGRFAESHVDAKTTTIGSRSPQMGTNLLNRGVAGGKTLSEYMLGSGEMSPTLPIQSSMRPSKPAATTSTTLPRAVHTSPLRAPVPKVSIELSKNAELDPVLALLQSDVSQLDEFRNSFREKSKLPSLSLSLSKPVCVRS